MRWGRVRPSVSSFDGRQLGTILGATGVGSKKPDLRVFDFTLLFVEVNQRTEIEKIE